MTAQSPTSPGADSPSNGDNHTEPDNADLEHFRPTGTVFILAAFVLTLILLWLSVYVILISRGVTT